MSHGIDGYSGAYLRDITRGETVLFSLIFEDYDTDDPIDVSDCKMYVAYNTDKTCSNPLLETIILPQDALGGIMAGSVPDDDTFGLPVGKMYGSIRFITPNGETHIIDKARLKVHQCINPRRAQ